MYAKLPFELSGSMPDNLYLGLVDDAPFGALPSQSQAPTNQLTLNSLVRL